MKLNENPKIKTLIPFEELESEALEQIKSESSRPFLKKLVLMPDCHTGYMLPIGGVALLDGIISPQYVGYDLGCGMCCIVTDVLSKAFMRKRKQIFDDVLNIIPLGTNRRKESLPYHEFKSNIPLTKTKKRQFEDSINATLGVQLGTLGGGKCCLQAE